MGMLDVQYTLGGYIYINHFVFDGNDKDGKHNLLHITCHFPASYEGNPSPILVETEGKTQSQI